MEVMSVAQLARILARSELRPSTQSGVVTRCLSTVKLAVGIQDTGTKAHQLVSILWATSSGSATRQALKRVGRFVQKILHRQSRSHALAQTVTSQDSHALDQTAIFLVLHALDQTATFLALHALDQIATFQVAQVTTVTSRT
jgi:hypothetical protein